jgi:hypothetical protein
MAKPAVAEAGVPAVQAIPVPQEELLATRPDGQPAAAAAAVRSAATVQTDMARLVAAAADAVPALQATLAAQATLDRVVRPVLRLDQSQQEQTHR